MPRRFWFGLVALLAAALLTPAAPAADAVSLELKFKEGDTFYIENVNNSKLTMEFAGIKNEQDSDTTIITRFKVLKSDKDETVIEQKIEKFKTKSSGLGSGADKIMDSLTGVTFKMTMNSKGEVTKFEGYDDFIKKLKTGDDEAAKMAKLILSEETLKANAADSFAFLPPKPVNKGDSWKHSQTVPLGPLGTFKGDTKYTYKGQGKDGEEIAFEQGLSYSPPKEDDNTLPFKVTKGEMKAEDASGKIIFDAAKGRVVRAESTQTIKGSLTIDVMGNSVTMDMNMKQTSKSRVLDKAPLD
jgi:hypothetical protein